MAVYNFTNFIEQIIIKGVSVRVHISNLTQFSEQVAGLKFDSSGIDGGSGKDVKLYPMLQAELELIIQHAVEVRHADDCTAASGNSEDIPLLRFLT